MLIGLTGKARSGKDTVADYLVKELEFTRFAFADPIKAALAHLAKERISLWSDDKTKEEVCPLLGITRRKAMQTFGTEFARNQLNKDVWVNRLMLELKEAKKDFVVIPDVRFNNEALAIREAGGFIIKLTRQEFGIVSEHESEHGILPDFISSELLNNSNKADLIKAAVSIIESVESQTVHKLLERVAKSPTDTKDSTLMCQDCKVLMTEASIASGQVRCNYCTGIFRR